MKSKLLAILAIIFFSISFTACMDEDISPVNSGENQSKGQDQYDEGQF